MNKKSLILLKSLNDPMSYYSHKKIYKKDYMKIKESFEFKKLDLSSFELKDEDMIILQNEYLDFQILETVEPEFYDKNYKKNDDNKMYFHVKKRKVYRINFSENSLAIINSLLENLEIKESLDILDSEKTKRRI